jgi:hypothetical protein
MSQPQYGKTLEDVRPFSNGDLYEGCQQAPRLLASLVLEARRMTGGSLASPQQHAWRLSVLLLARHRAGWAQSREACAAQHGRRIMEWRVLFYACSSV